MSERAITGREMRSLEINSEYFGFSRLQMMENAGRNVANEIASRFTPKDTRIAVFCGLGGNGGDGFVAARHLACLGFKVDILLAGKSIDNMNEETRKNWQILQFLTDTITLNELYDSSLIPDVNVEVVVDALLGVGLKGSLRPPILQLVKKINELKAFCVSIDVPTGIDSDSGEVLGDAVRSDLTVTLHKMKLGLTNAEEYAGEIVVREIGLPSEIERFVGPGDVSLVIQPRHPESHKGHFGRLLIVGGSEVFSGAPALVALAALRTGVDITYVVAPHRTAYEIASMSPNLITIKLEGDHLNPRNVSVIKPYLKIATAIVVGPGLGMHKDTKEAVKDILQLIVDEGTPLLLDADGLKAFAEYKQRITSPLVLTPHAGEYQLLTGKELPTDVRKRAIDVQKSAQELGGVILLKGHVDIISDGERVKFNLTGNPGMTVGGTGDILSGIVGAFLAQKADLFDAATAGAFINGAAGDFVQHEKGYHMVPTDIIDCIPKVMCNPMSHQTMQKKRINQFLF
ncbi:NAD(P)H-hydrate dehydratase [Candidatus Bathyarchaeota archaeon]|nr:NAD(P)H-hydrate dehydratase [Candidatus Bathyarchaeota archaeon]